MPPRIVNISQPTLHNFPHTFRRDDRATKRDCLACDCSFAARVSPPPTALVRQLESTGCVAHGNNNQTVNPVRVTSRPATHSHITHVGGVMNEVSLKKVRCRATTDAWCVDSLPGVALYCNAVVGRLHLSPPCTATHDVSSTPIFVCSTPRKYIMHDDADEGGVWPL